MRDCASYRCDVCARKYDLKNLHVEEEVGRKETINFAARVILRRSVIDDTQVRNLREFDSRTAPAFPANKPNSTYP